VHTFNQKSDLRMSLTKAVSFLDTGIGTRVHRSHWVRNSEMKSLTYKNGNPYLELHSGKIIPVGRNMVNSVKFLITEAN